MSKVICGNTLGTGNFVNVKVAVIQANKMLGLDDFYRQIAQHSSFDSADATPALIATFMRDANITMTLDLYHSPWPELNIDGYDDTDEPQKIHLNIWRTNRSPESICNSIIHAFVHAVNALHPGHGFGHGDSLLTGKENTAPYWIGALAQRLLSAEDPIIIQLEHEPGLNVAGVQQHTSFAVSEPVYH